MAYDHRTQEINPDGSFCIPEGPRIALTFDDGPNAIKTPKILDILNIYNTPATFFVVGKYITPENKTLKRIYEEEHEIGVHTYNHYNLYKLTPEMQNYEIKAGYDAIKKVLPYVNISYWRAPFGNAPKPSPKITSELDLEHVYWTIDTNDWRNEGSEMWWYNIEKDLKTRGNQIILMHDHAQVTIDELENLIILLRDRGYHLVSTSMLKWPTCTSKFKVKENTNSVEIIIEN